MPFALERLAYATGTDPEYLLERHTLFPYAVAFMALERREAFKARALADGNLCRLDTLGHVVLKRTPYRRVCPQCIADDMRAHGETYWRRSHLLPGVHVCVTHDAELVRTAIPLQGGRDTSDALLPHEAPLCPSKRPLPIEVLESIAAHSVRALTRPPADRPWLDRYCLAAFALGYQLRRRAVASVVIARDLKHFYGDAFLVSMNASVELAQKSPWPALLVRPHYPVRLATPKHILMLTFLEHARPITGLGNAPYRRPGPVPRDYKLVDAVALARMRAYVKANARKGRRLTVSSLREASGEQPCMHRFKERFPRSLRFLEQFRRSKHAARRLRKPDPYA
jgi:hypothetical protein